MKKRRLTRPLGVSPWHLRRPFCYIVALFQTFFFFIYNFSKILLTKVQNIFIIISVDVYRVFSGAK